MRTLQTAWEAIEKGDHVEAQSLVAQMLRDDPQNAEAWMVLGEAVSGDRQVLFLRKALQLNPDLERAKNKLAELESADDELVAMVEETVEEQDVVTAAVSEQPPVPPNVSLDAPTISIEERLNADRAAPKQANLNKAKTKDKPKKSNLMNNVLLFLVLIGICITLYFLIQAIMG